MIEGVSVGAFRTLLWFLYVHKLPEEEDCGQGLEMGEMVRVVDRFQAVALYKHCVQQFKGGMAVGNVVARLVLAHDSGLAALEEAGMRCFEANATTFQVRLSCHFRMKCVVLLKFMMVLKHCETDASLNSLTRYQLFSGSVLSKPSRRQLRLVMCSICMRYRQLLLVGQLSLEGSSEMFRAHNQRFRLIKDGHLPKETGKET